MHIYPAGQRKYQNKSFMKTVPVVGRMCDCGPLTVTSNRHMLLQLFSSSISGNLTENIRRAILVVFQQ